MQLEFTSLMFAIIAILLAAAGRALEFIAAVALAALVIVLWHLHRTTAQDLNNQKLEMHDQRKLLKALSADAKLARNKLNQHILHFDQTLQITQAEHATLLETIRNQRDAARAESTTARRLLRHGVLNRVDFVQGFKGRVAKGACCASKPLTNEAVAAGAVPGLISWAPAATYPPGATPLSPSSSIVPTAATTYPASINIAAAAKVFLGLLNLVSVATPPSSIPSSPSAVSTRTPTLLPNSTASTSSSQIIHTAGPSTDKQASPLLTKSNVITAKAAVSTGKSSLSLKSADLPAATSSRIMPAETSVTTQLPSPKLIETAAAKSAPTPAKMTKAAEFPDPISQGLPTPVPSPVVALSPASTSASPPTTAVAPFPAQTPPVPAAANISRPSAAVGPSKPSLSADAILVKIASGVPLPPPDEDEETFFSKDSPPKHAQRAIQATQVKPKVPVQPVVIPPGQQNSRCRVVTKPRTIKRVDLGLEHEKRNRSKLMPKRRSMNQKNATLERMQLKAGPTEAQTEVKDSEMELTVEPNLEEKRAQMEAEQPTAELEPKQSKSEQTVDGASVLPTQPAKNSPTPAINTSTNFACVPSVSPTKNNPSPPAKMVPTSTLTPAASSVVDVPIKPVVAIAAPATTGAVLVPTTETAIPTTEAAVTTTEEIETTTIIAQPEPVTTTAASSEAPTPAPQKEVHATQDQKKPAMETKPKEDPNGWIDALDGETKLGIIKLVSQARQALNSAQDPVDMFQNIDGYFATTMDLSIRAIETHYQYLQKTGFVQSTYEVDELLPSVLKALPDYFILEH